MGSRTGFGEGWFFFFLEQCIKNGFVFLFIVVVIEVQSAGKKICVFVIHLLFITSSTALFPYFSVRAFVKLHFARCAS